MHSPAIASTYLLSERRSLRFPASLAEKTRTYHFTLFFMKTTHLAFFIRRQIPTATCEIPASAWTDLARDLRDIFDATMHVHDRSRPRRNADLPPHYRLEIVVQGAHEPEDLMPLARFVAPRIEAIARKHSTPRIPLAR